MKYKTELEIAWEKFILNLSEELGVIKFLNWLVKKLDKFGF